MREIHYIDGDEEIISAVSRLRKSSQGENVFIFPKRALILQSIVNLRLLEREAKKLGKQIIVVSQDEAGRKLAEKAGLVIEEYRDQNLEGTKIKETARFSVESHENAIPTPEVASRGEVRLSSAHIGSDSFFSDAPSPSTISVNAPSPPEPLPAAVKISPKRLRIRDVSGPVLTTLNSQRFGTPTTAFPTELPPSQGRVAPTSSFQTPQFPTSPVVEMSPSQPRLMPNQKLARFMGTKKSTGSNTPVSLQEDSRQKVSPMAQPAQGQRFSWGLLVLGFLVLGGVAAVGWFVLFPSATVTLEPQSTEQVVRFQTTASTTHAETSANVIAGRVVTLERTIHLTEQATGSASNESAKAQGKIRIYNDFSKDPQPLVATTRFETKDGKVFRLVKAVTVPGVTETGGKRERGMVEALVIADQAGEAYNIGITTFTIPGFKGSPKYEKFTAESLQAFLGGSNTGGSKAVSNEDLNRAKEKAQKEARQAALDEWKSQLQSGETLLEDSLLFVEKIPVLSPVVGTAATEFQYETRLEVKAFVIDELALRERIKNERVTTGGVTLAPKEFDLRYSALLPKFDAGKIDLTVESTVLFQAELDQEKLKEALLGQDEEGIKSFLERHPEVERLQVEFHPQLLVSTLPKNGKRVSLEIIQQDKSEP